MFHPKKLLRDDQKLDVGQVATMALATFKPTPRQMLVGVFAMVHDAKVMQLVYPNEIQAQNRATTNPTQTPDGREIHSVKKGDVISRMWFSLASVQTKFDPYHMKVLRVWEHEGRWYASVCGICLPEVKYEEEVVLPAPFQPPHENTTRASFWARVGKRLGVAR